MTPSHFLTIVIGATVLCGSIQSPREEVRQLPQWPSPAVQRQMVANTKRLSAQALDSTQAAVPLEQWLHETLGPKATLEWEVGDCDLKPEYPEPPDGHSMCVAVRASLPPRIGLRLHVLVGTFKRGVFGQPSIEKQSFMGCSSLVDGPVASISRLADIPRTIESFSSKEKCR